LPSSYIPSGKSRWINWRSFIISRKERGEKGEGKKKSLPLDPSGKKVNHHRGVIGNPPEKEREGRDFIFSHQKKTVSPELKGSKKDKRRDPIYGARLRN